MSRNVIRISAPPDAVFDVLDDAPAYARWVLGTRRIRAVDPDWPAVGSRFHHAIGTSAGELHDSSKVVERHRPDHLVLEVRFRPTGVALVTIDVRPADGGSELSLEEHPQRGPFAKLPHFVTEPALTARNAISLQRLRHEIERRSRQPSDAR